MGSIVVEEGEYVAIFGIVFAANNRESALPHCRQPIDAAHEIGNSICKTEAFESGKCENDRVIFTSRDLCEAGVDIAAQVEHFDIGPECQQLRASAKGARSDPGAARKSCKRFRNAGSGH